MSVSLSQICVLQSVSSPIPDPSMDAPLPLDGPSWLWWFVSALPIGEEKKAQFLLSTSLKERILLLRSSLPLPGRSLNVGQGLNGSKTGLGKTSQQRDEYDVLKQVMPIAYDANKLDLRTNSCCLSVWLFIQPSLVSVF